MVDPFDFALLNYAAMTNTALLAPRRRTPGFSQRHIRWFSTDNLRYHVQRELPLLVEVSASSTTADSVVYNCNMSSVASKKSWTVSYQYSDFLDFKTKLETEWTCHNANCSGSCQALRGIVSAFFPKKRLAIMSSSHGAVTSRKQKFQFVRIHLLRSILLPGSVMKCMHARESLSINVFKFLGVTGPGDRRSLLQIFVDSSQGTPQEEENEKGIPDNQDPSPSMAAATQCMICLSGDHHNRISKSGATDDSNADRPVHAAGESADSNDSQITLPCHHTFHRACIFQWLLFEFHCPVCRTGIFPTAITNHCRAARNVQWWLSDFEEEEAATSE